jgi:hypothetical protein
MTWDGKYCVARAPALIVTMYWKQNLVLGISVQSRNTDGVIRVPNPCRQQSQPEMYGTVDGTVEPVLQLGFTTVHGRITGRVYQAASRCPTKS